MASASCSQEEHSGSLSPSEDQQTLDLADSFSRRIDLTGDPFAAPAISDAASLEEHLPKICTAIYKQLSSRQLEATYQRCLAIELKSAGVLVAQEVELLLCYKGERVGTRRADLVLTTKDGCRAIAELKAVASLSSEHLKQLEFYMHHFKIDTGFLVSFPHDSGFPEVDLPGRAPSIFDWRVLSGADAHLSDRHTHGKQADAAVQIIMVTRRAAPVRGESSAQPSSPPIPEALHTPTETPSGHFGVTKQGVACKLCIKYGGFCAMHSDQQARA
jgi:GxxExxY protein